jgi:hypothetical protein
MCFTPPDPDDLDRWDRAMRHAENPDDTDGDDYTRLGILSPILTFDTIYRFRGSCDDGGVCRVRIFESDDQPPVVVVTVRAENTSTSITNLIEHLAPELIKTYLPARLHETPPAVFIAHYDEILDPRTRRQRLGPRASRVTFSSWTPKIVSVGGVDRLSYGEPSWTHLDETALAIFIGEGVSL